VGHIITNQRPDFDSRTYGYAKLSDLIEATTLFALERRSPGDGKPGIIFTRAKRRSPSPISCPDGAHQPPGRTGQPVLKPQAPNRPDMPHSG
jgi:hypothetical protein